MVEQAQKGVDEQDEQQRGEGRTLGRPGVHEYVRSLFLPHADPHGGQIIEDFKQVNIRNPELLQNGPKANMSRRVEGVGIVEVNTYKLTIARFGKFKKELLFLDTVCNPV